MNSIEEIQVFEKEGVLTHTKAGKLHRDNGPAIENRRGYQEWWNEGVRHREDGPAIIHVDGAVEYWQKGQRHREDGPALILKDGTKKWYKKDLLHRLDGPAVEWADGGKEYWVEGKRHRLDGPAVERANGRKEYWVEGQLHRLDGPAIEWANGTKQYRRNGKLHRLDGPAIERADGYKAWYRNDKLHRLDGPAIEMADGYKEYWIEGIKCEEKDLPLAPKGENTPMEKEKSKQMDPKNEPSSTIFEEAEAIVNGPRAKTYGSFAESTTRIAKLWEAYLGLPIGTIKAKDVCMMMILLKVSREKGGTSHRDNLVDIAGYARGIEKIQEETER